MPSYVLKLFVAGDTVRSRTAIAGLQECCYEELRGEDDEYQIEIIDVLEYPEQAELAKVVATPTLLKIEPVPERRTVGVMETREHILEALGITNGMGRRSIRWENSDE